MVTVFKLTGFLGIELLITSKMSDELSRDGVVAAVSRMLFEQRDAPSTSNPIIYRVNDCLRGTKGGEYEPIVISIGPMYHGKDELSGMEDKKGRYVSELIGQSSSDIFVSAIREMEPAARKYYAEAILPERDTFVLMLLLDASFIIVFLRERAVAYKGKEKVADEEGNAEKMEVAVSKDPISPIFECGNEVYHFRRDLLLLENQIPLFVLQELFNLSKSNDEEKFIDLIWPLLPPTTPVPEGMELPDDARHLLGVVHYVTCRPFDKTLKSGNNLDFQNIHSAVELKEAGMVFKKSKNDNTDDRLAVTFKNNTIYISELVVGDVTESLFRNLIAYECSFPRTKPRCISDFVYVLNCLIHSSKDAKLLRHCGIISNQLGSDARVSELINSLGTNAQRSVNFSYLEVFQRINDHCRLRRKKWFAVLRHKYLSNPWTVIPLAVAAVLLIAAVVAGVFTILTYFLERHRKS